MTEAELERAVRALLKTYRLWGYHPYDSRRSQPGFPDWVVISPKGVLWRELKTDTGQLTKEQVRVRNMLQAAGEDWSCWRPADLLSGRIARELAAIV